MLHPHQKLDFLVEAGIDGGGLSREYGTLLRKAIFSTEAKPVRRSMYKEVTHLQCQWNSI